MRLVLKSTRKFSCLIVGVLLLLNNDDDLFVWIKVLKQCLLNWCYPIAKRWKFRIHQQAHIKANYRGQIVGSTVGSSVATKLKALKYSKISLSLSFPTPPPPQSSGIYATVYRIIKTGSEPRPPIFKSNVNKPVFQYRSPPLQDSSSGQICALKWYRAMDLCLWEVNTKNIKVFTLCTDKRAFAREWK